MPESTALAPLAAVERGTTEIERRVSEAGLIERPEDAEELLRDIGLRQKLADVAGFDFHTARLSVARDRLLEALSPLVQMGSGTTRKTVHETVLSKPLKQAIQTNRSDWKGVPDERREQVRSEKVEKGEALTRRDKRSESKKVATVAAVEESKRMRADPLPLPTDSLWQVVLADPPWRYEHVKTNSRAIEQQYPTMALEDICAMPVASLCAPDAVLYLWATAPKLEEALSVMATWEFTYRTCAVWTKPQIGMGYWFRQQHEILLVGTRGHPGAPLEALRRGSVFEAPRTKHSAKPTAVAEMIEAQYPERARVELFSRSPRRGWLAHGTDA